MAQYRQVVAEGGSSTRVTERPAWSPAQIFGLIGGLVLVVIGGVGLARSGINMSHLAATHSMVAGLGFTSLSALVQLVAGVILLAGSAYPDTAKGTMAVFGVILLAWGLIVAIDPAPFFSAWGYVTANGVFYAIVGGVLLVVAAVSPIFMGRDRVTQVSSGTQVGPPVTY